MCTLPSELKTLKVVRNIFSKLNNHLLEYSITYFGEQKSVSYFNSIFI